MNGKDTPMEDRIEALPKVELHIHLEGSIPTETLMRLAKRNGVDLPATTLEEFLAWYRFTDFPRFAEVFQAISKSIRKPEDLEEIARDFLAVQAAQNILHTEATFTAVTHWRNAGIPFDEQMDAIGRAAEWARDELGVGLGLIVDIPREFASTEEADMTAKWVADHHGRGLVLALGLGGYEVGFPPEIFASQFALAAEAGVPAVVHAGETGGADSVRGAIEALNAIRIGHGVRVLEDEAVVDLVRERGIVLEVCPTSNLCLKVFDRAADHPFPTLVDKGLTVTINSDDPAIFGSDLTGEMVLLSEAFGYTAAQLKALMRTAAEASLLDAGTKQSLLARLDGG